MRIPTCQLANTWLEFDACEFGWLYCSVVDQAKVDGYCKNVQVDHLKNLCRGDEYCLQTYRVVEDEN